MNYELTKRAASMKTVYCFHNTHKGSWGKSLLELYRAIKIKNGKKNAKICTYSNL